MLRKSIFENGHFFWGGEGVVCESSIIGIICRQGGRVVKSLDSDAEGRGFNPRHRRRPFSPWVSELRR